MESINDPTIIADVTISYPAWQGKMRAAQEAAEAMVEATVREEKEKKRLQAEKDGALLGRALSYFGIVAAPTENAYRLDEFNFYLRKPDKYTKTLFEENVESRSVRFSLGVSYILPEEYAESYDSDYHGRIFSDVYCNWITATDTKHHASLAYALDEIANTAKSFIQQECARRSREVAEVVEPEDPTLEQQLGDLLTHLVRKIVREEAMNNGVEDFGF